MYSSETRKPDPYIYRNQSNQMTGFYKIGTLLVKG